LKLLKLNYKLTADTCDTSRRVTVHDVQAQRSRALEGSPGRDPTERTLPEADMHDSHLKPRRHVMTLSI